MKTECLGKTWFWSYSQKWLSANEISVFFNRQYFTNRLISHFDFWHVDRHEWKEQGSLTYFMKKIIILANGPFYAQKLHILITLDLLEGSFWNFAQWKGLVRWKRYSLIFQKNCFEQIDHFGPKNGASSQLWIGCKNFL